MSAQFVKAYVKPNKNDWRDAEAICEAGFQEAVPLRSTSSHSEL